MFIASPAFEPDECIPPKYTCDEDDISPPLQFGEIPEDAESLVLIVDDPDAPRGTWVHWLVWNMSPTTIDIPEGSVPSEAVEGQTDFGTPGYGGPCPPDGEHRYVFTLYALDTELELDESANRDELELEMEDHIIATAELVGRYDRI